MPTDANPVAAAAAAGPRAGLLRYLAAAFSIAIYAGLAPVGYLGFMLLAKLPTRDPDRRARRLHAVQHHAFTLMFHWLRWFRLLDFDPRAVPGEIPREPCIFVANHPTLADIAALFAALGGMVTVAKPAVFRLWWLRPLLADGGQIEGSDGTPAGTARVLEAAVERLQAGFQLAVFPEGTRSPPGGMREFGRGAFEIACRAGVPVVPVVIRCNPVWLSRESRLRRPPRETPVMRLEVLPKFLPADYEYDSRTLRQEVENVYRGARETLGGQPREEEPCRTILKTG